MIDPVTTNIWIHRILFVVIALTLLFWRLLPLEHSSQLQCAAADQSCLLRAWFAHIPGPDIMLCIVFAWTMRRPDFLPVILIAVVVLLEDLILLRPPGLWTALVIIAAEFVRSRVILTRELNFWVEWLLVSGLMLAMLLIYRLVFALVLLPQTGFGFAIVQVIGSIICYPAVVFLSRVVLDLHKPAMGEIDAYGRRM
jgi:rod shape-determining protein MreD